MGASVAIGRRIALSRSARPLDGTAHSLGYHRRRLETAPLLEPSSNDNIGDIENEMEKEVEKEAKMEVEEKDIRKGDEAIGFPAAPPPSSPFPSSSLLPPPLLPALSGIPPPSSTSSPTKIEGERSHVLSLLLLPLLSFPLPTLPPHHDPFSSLSPSISCS